MNLEKSGLLADPLRLRGRPLPIGKQRVKAPVGKRTKQSRMFWRVPGAQHILDIRCAILGNTEENYWKYRRKQDL